MQRENNDRSVVKRQDNDVPTYFDGEDLGVDSIDQSDIVIPRLKICQALSEIHSTTSIADGEIYNTVSGEIYGGEINFFVLLHYKTDIWFSKDNKFIATRFFNPTTREYEWIGNEEGINFAKGNDKLGLNCHNFMLLLEDDLKAALNSKDLPFPIIYNAISGAVKYAKKLNSKLKGNALSFHIPIYGQCINMTTHIDTFPAGKAFMPTFAYGRYATKEEAPFLKELMLHCKKLQIRSDVVHDTADTADTAIKNEPDVFDEAINDRGSEEKSQRRTSRF